MWKPLVLPVGSRIRDQRIAFALEGLPTTHCFHMSEHEFSLSMSIQRISYPTDEPRYPDKVKSR
jgi:hypothetical protein